MYLVHHALGNIYNLRKRTMVIYIFSASFKGKGVYFKKKKILCYSLFIKTLGIQRNWSVYYSLYIKRWAYKGIKMYYKSKPYFLFLSWANDQMESGILWNDERKTWLYAPRQHINILEFCIMNWWNWRAQLGHFSWGRIQLFVSAKSTAVGDNWHVDGHMWICT